jgi:hypothetical protein
MALFRYDGATGIYTTLASVNTGGFPPQTWINLSLKVQGETLTASVDGREVLSARDTTLTAGRAGVAGYPAGDLEFDNLTVLALPAGGQP